MPCISTSEKSIEVSKACSCPCGVAKPSRSRPMTASDTASAIAMTPIVIGHFRYRWLR